MPWSSFLAPSNTTLSSSAHNGDRQESTAAVDVRVVGDEDEDEGRNVAQVLQFDDPPCLIDVSQDDNNNLHSNQEEQEVQEHDQAEEPVLMLPTGGRSRFEPPLPATVSPTNNIDVEERYQQLLRDVCPLFDRLGRIFTDIAPHIWQRVEPNSTLRTTGNRTSDPLHSLEARLMSLLRERPASPPPMHAYRAPIAAPPVRMEPSVVIGGARGLNPILQAIESSLLSESLASLASGGGRNSTAAPATPATSAATTNTTNSTSNTTPSTSDGGSTTNPSTSNTTTGTGTSNTSAGAGAGAAGRRSMEHHVDIHIAILSPPSRASPSVDTHNLSRAVASLTASLQAQAQSLAARTQELSERTNAVSEITSAISQAIRNATINNNNNGTNNTSNNATTNSANTAVESNTTPATGAADPPSQRQEVNNASSSASTAQQQQTVMEALYEATEVRTQAEAMSSLNEMLASMLANDDIDEDDDHQEQREEEEEDLYEDEADFEIEEDENENEEDDNDDYDDYEQDCNDSLVQLLDTSSSYEQEEEEEEREPGTPEESLLLTDLLVENTEESTVEPRTSLMPEHPEQTSQLPYWNIANQQ